MKNLILLFLLIGIETSAQLKIDLSDSEKKIKYKSVSTISSIYVLKDNTILLEKDTVFVYNIGKLISLDYFKAPTDVKMYYQVHLFADKSANYSLIDEIKTQLSSVYTINRIYYQMGILEDITSGFAMDLHPSFFKLQPIEEKLTKVEQRISDSINSNLHFDDFSIPPPPSPAGYELFLIKEKIYSIQKEVINEVLVDNNYTCITVTNEGVKFNNNKIEKFSNTDLFKKVLLENDLIFVRFDKELKYNQYIIYLNHLMKLSKECYETNNKYPQTIDLSFEILKLHQENNIIICE